MKYLSIICVLLGMQSFSLENAVEDIHLLDGLPANFSYQLNSDSIAIFSNKRNIPRLTYAEKKMTIGCNNPVQIEALFSIVIEHQFLFEDAEVFDFFIKNKKASEYKLILYGVKKENKEQDALLLSALSEYCAYGQAEYAFQSEEFILFTYSPAMNSAGAIIHLKQLGFWNMIEPKLKENLNSGASFETKTQLPISVTNPYHKKSFIKGEFISGKIETLSDKVKTEDDETHTSNTRPISHAYLKLKNNSSTWINDFDPVKRQKVKYFYKYKCTWFMDNMYVYVYNPKLNIKAFRIQNENTLIHISEKYGFSRLQN